MEENLIENIVPSKPFESYEDIEFLAVKAKDKVARIQVDICDGEYVKNVSWPFTEISKKDFVTWGTTEIKENAGLRDLYMPQAYDLAYTADMMCKNPEKYIDTLVQYGFDEIIVHARSLENTPLVQLGAGQTSLKKEGSSALEILKTCENYDLKLYLAIDMKTNFSEFSHILQALLETRSPNFAGVQVMGIENIGVQGQEFVKESLDLVKKIKQELKKFPDLKILFDGGINEDNLLDLKNAGVDVFCVGHLLTEGDFKENLKFIKNTVNF